MNPVVYNAGNKAIVDSFNGLPDNDKDASYWGHEDVKPVRKQIKDHYILEQKQRCCHCNMDLKTANNAVWDGEHIMSRNLHAKFMFFPHNLAVSCKDCNIEKGEKEVRVNATRKTFPTKSSDYIIVHPHFDKYDEHIRWYGDVCRPFSKKGEKTISICRLTRFALAEIGAEDETPQSEAYDKAVGTLLNPHSTILEKQMATAAIAEFLKQAKENPG